MEGCCIHALHNTLKQSPNTCVYYVCRTQTRRVYRTDWEIQSTAQSLYISNILSCASIHTLVVMYKDVAVGLKWNLQRLLRSLWYKLCVGLPLIPSCSVSHGQEPWADGCSTQSVACEGQLCPCGSPSIQDSLRPVLVLWSLCLGCTDEIGKSGWEALEQGCSTFLAFLIDSLLVAGCLRVNLRVCSWVSPPEAELQVSASFQSSLPFGDLHWRARPPPATCTRHGEK